MGEVEHTSSVVAVASVVLPVEVAGTEEQRCLVVLGWEHLHTAAGSPAQAFQAVAYQASFQVVAAIESVLDSVLTHHPEVAAYQSLEPVLGTVLVALVALPGSFDHSDPEPIVVVVADMYESGLAWPRFATPSRP